MSKPEPYTPERHRSLGAFHAIPDLITVNLLTMLTPADLFVTQAVSRGFYMLSNVESVWAAHTLPLVEANPDCRNFFYHGNWKRTFLTLKAKTTLPAGVAVPLSFPDIPSQYLYWLWYRGNMDLGTFVPEQETVPKLLAADLNLERFINEFDAPSCPALIQGCTQAWSPLSTFTPHNLISLCGDAEFGLSHLFDVGHEDASGKGKKSKRAKMTMAQYVHYMRSQHDESPLYIFDAKACTTCPQLTDHFDVASLAFFPEDFYEVLGSRRPDFQWMVCGPARTGASWHIDPSRTSAWNALLHGRKRWAMYPPDHPPPGVTTHEDPFGRVKESYDGRSSLLWYLEVYPTLSLEERPYEVIQGPGDVIYVPSGWWHMVLNLEETVSLTQNFVNQGNLRHVIQDIVSDGQGPDPFNIAFQAYLESKHDWLAPQYRLSSMYVPEGYACVEHMAADFGNAKAWLPAVKRVCKRHGLRPPAKVKCDCCDGKRITMRGMTSSTNPVFQVEEANVIVKFFSPFTTSMGPPSPQCGWDTDIAAYAALCGVAAVGAPKLLASGHLRDEDSVAAWKWPYLVLSCLPGKTLHSVIDDAEGDDDDDDDEEEEEDAPPKLPLGRTLWPSLVKWLASAVAAMHTLPISTRMDVEPVTLRLASSPVAVSQDCARHGWRPLLPRTPAAVAHVPAAWHDYLGFLLKQRTTVLAHHMRWARLPPPLIKELDLYLPSVQDLARLLPGNAHPPCFLHGDLNDDNIVGGVEPGRPAWAPSGIIDFADSRIGDPLYDMIALFVSALRCDPSRFRAFLHHYRRHVRAAGRPELLAPCPTLPYRATCLLLLHPVDALRTVDRFREDDFALVTSLRGLEDVVFGGGVLEP